MLTLAAHPARRWEPKWLRLRRFSVAGRPPAPPAESCCTSTKAGRRTHLLVTIITALCSLPAPTNN